MFKSKKTYPSTPKIPSVSLPDDVHTPWFSSVPKTFSMFPKGFKQHPLFHRSMTPTPERPRRDSMTTPSSSRTRTSSLSSLSSSVNPKPILKPPKAELPPKPSSHIYPVPQRPVYHVSAMPAAMKHRPIDMSDARVLSKPAITRSRHASRDYASDDEFRKLKSKLRDESYQPSKRHSHSKSRSVASDYVQVTQTPLKSEAIALSWPLIDFSQPKRDRHPRLYFDIGFDPRYDLNVRIDRGGIFTRITKEEGDIPASSHCTLTKMVIICKELSRWPVVVEQEAGLTCMDIFYGIYKTFHEPLTRSELRDMDRSYLDRCRPHQMQRCRDAPGLTDINLREGLLRVDLLRTGKIFKGLKQSGSEWILTLESPARPG